ncbi:hypothetical protein ACJ41O_008719 [Fusarium nematophilum]
MNESKPPPTHVFSKARHLCQLARSQGLDFAWMDTCCIDKASGTELNEAINSMYTWYENSILCVVYLADVPGGDAQDADKRDEWITRSRWFTRGWTLLELLAPRQVVFYARDWTPLGTKETLLGLVARVTGIDPRVLSHERHPKRATTVTERMSWSARRDTTRAEDGAYCLLGLLDVSMSLNYGEGRRNAFLRLWDEILRNNEDYTVLLWRNAPDRHYYFPLVPQNVPLSPSSRGRSGDAFEKLDWAQLKLHSPLDLASTTVLAGHLPLVKTIPQVPQITVRGLRMSLLAKVFGSGLVAWTYSTQERNGKTYAVCVGVIPTDFGSLAESQHLRGATNGEVYHVEVSRLRSFELKDIYFPLAGRNDGVDEA